MWNHIRPIKLPSERSLARTEAGIGGNFQHSPQIAHHLTARRARASLDAALLALCPALASCSGVQSALDPAGEEAEQVATLFWTMTAGALLIWAAVVAVALYASRWKRQPISERVAGQVILWAGGVFPVTVLVALLAFALWLMPALRPFAAGGELRLRIEMTGHQFWWHVVYRQPDGTTTTSANEVRLPVGERVEFQLTSADMIHSFWIPALGGKMDLIPGRTNRLSLLATKPGTYRGQCAEFCGTSHARMAFSAIAMGSGDFRSWLSARGRPSEGVGAGGGRGRELFQREKCGECHRVEGTQSRGTAGPDLSHVGSRLTLAAGQMDNDVDTLSRFIAHAGSMKPGSQMPAYLHLSASERDEIAAWLKGLQ